MGASLARRRQLFVRRGRVAIVEGLRGGGGGGPRGGRLGVRRGRVGAGVEGGHGVHEVLEHLRLHELAAEELGAWMEEGYGWMKSEDYQLHFYLRRSIAGQ